MLLIKWRVLIIVGCAVLITTLSACNNRPNTPTPGVTPSIAPTAIARSTLPTPVPRLSYPQDEGIILVRPNGDVVLYTLMDQRAIVLLKEAFFFSSRDGERYYYPYSVSMRLSPDGKWLLIATLDQGTWLVAMDGSTQRQISPNNLEATWAPNSQQITYIGWQAATGNAPLINILYTHNIVAGDAPHPLLKSEASIGPAVWSPGCETTPAPAGRSCGQHIFIFSRLDPDGDEPTQALLVDVPTSQVTQLGPYAGPARETATFEYRWSPDGDEFWAPGSSSMMAAEGIAFQIDGSAPRPLVAGCDSSCLWDLRDGKATIGGGWTILYEPGSTNEEIYAQSPTGEQIEIATDAYFVGTLEQLHSTEVGKGHAELQQLNEYSAPDQWNERVLHEVGVSYRLPPQWDESGPDGDKSVHNYRIAAPTGMVSLGDEMVSVHIKVAPFDGNSDAFRRLWMQSLEAKNNRTPDPQLLNTLINDYDRQVYQVTGELVAFASQPAVRVYSDLWPFAEKTVVLLKGFNLEITVWSRPGRPNPTLESILSSIVLPSYEEESPESSTPTPVAPSPLATP